jgi:Uma2 family endonuclease
VAGPRTKFTREDYEQTPDDWRGELIEGDLLVIPSPTRWHQSLIGKLYQLLLEHFGDEVRHRVLLSPSDVHIDKYNILQPDILVLPAGLVAGTDEWDEAMPVWVAEVLSPSTAHRDRGIKLTIYARAGVKEAWLIDPAAEAITVHDLGSGSARTFGSSETALSVVLDDLSVPVAGFFEV